MSNAGGAGVLAADACADLGLTVHQPRGLTRRQLRTLIPARHGHRPGGHHGRGIRRRLPAVPGTVAADDGVDAMIALILPTGATGDLITAIRQADVGVPLAAVVLDQAERPVMPRSAHGEIPAYAVPEAAAAALARAARYGAWRTEPRGQVPSFPDVRAADARALVTGFLHREPGGGWLPADKTADLLHCYGIWLVDAEPTGSEDEAVKAAGAVSGPVVLKAEVQGLTPETGANAVELDLHTEAEVRAAYDRLADRAAAGCSRVLVQPMVTGGTEVRIGVTDDRVFGPLVTFGPSDHAARLTPLTDTDADALIRSVRAAPRLLGQRGRRPTWRRCASCCCGSPGSPTTCPRSPSSISARSSPGRTGCSRWTRGSR